MVMVLLLVLVMALIQAALLVHARNVAAAVAADAARYGAGADRSTADAGPYADRALHDDLAARYADSLSCRSSDETGAAALVEVRVDCRGNLPLRIFGVGSVSVHVIGHALKEGP
jgi:Flp pilus assembly protein TadG